MSHPNSKPTPEREIVNASQHQKEYIENLSVFDKILKCLTRLIIAAIVAYVIYLAIDTAPTHPVDATSQMTPEQVREKFALFTSLVGFAVALWFLYDWRALWQWSVGVMKKLLQHKAK